MPPPRLGCHHVRKAFPGVLALDDVSLAVASGSIHAVVGENGAGKSTLMKILAGAVTPDAGTIDVDGHVARITDTRSAQRCGIAIVYQDFNLVPDLCVSENIYLGRWPRGGVPGWVDFSRLHRQAGQLLGMLGIELPVRRRVGELTVAQQQMVEIAKALSLNARILILDEPSAVLTRHELDILFALIRDLQRRGVSIIYISHRLDEVFEIADHVTVLRDGQKISSRPIDQLDRGRLIAEMVGRELTDEFPSRTCDIGDAVLQVWGLSVEKRFAGVSLDVRAGEVFALTGLIGSGRTSFAKTVFGAVRADRGTVRAGSVVGPFANPRQAVAAGIGMLPEDRKQQGLLLHRSLRENVTLANRSSIATAGILRPAAERRVVHRSMGDLQIKASGCDAEVNTLSGGNQQKVLLARWMFRPLKVVLFDEPTRGVDVGAKYEIYTLINRLAASGVAVLMISSELPEVIGMADRIGVMHEGRLRGVLDNRRRQVSQEQIMRLASGEGGAQ